MTPKIDVQCDECGRIVEDVNMKEFLASHITFRRCWAVCDGELKRVWLTPINFIMVNPQ